MKPQPEGEEAPEGPSTTAMLLTCEDTLEMKKLKGFAGKSWRAFCPKLCMKTEKFIFGTQIYHPYSAICKAAIHDGKIKNDQGGEFIIALTPMPHLFFGTNNNQVKSDSLQVEKGMTDFLPFTVQEAPKVEDIECDTKADDPIFKDPVGMRTYTCPENCSKIP